MSIFKRARGNGPGARTLRVGPNITIESTPIERPTIGPSTPSGASTANSEPRAFAPHCDQRILHAPDECWACDLYPNWQKLRQLWGIAFTGHQPKTETIGEEGYSFTVRELPCPADYNRPPDSDSDHRQWGPNRAQGEKS